jgi:hypothetical protein
VIRFDSIMAKWTRCAIFILLVFILTNCTKKTNLENKESIASNQVYRQKDITKIIDGLYPNIALDYNGVYKTRIFQDFGAPTSIQDGELSDIADIELLSTGILANQKFSCYTYRFVNGSIRFYIGDNNYPYFGHVLAVEILLPENISTVDDILIPIKMSNGKNMVLGKTTFQDVFESYYGSRQYLPSHHPEILYYGCGSQCVSNGFTYPPSIEVFLLSPRAQGYYIFRVHGFYDSLLREGDDSFNYQKVKDMKPTSVLIL